VLQCDEAAGRRYNQEDIKWQRASTFWLNSAKVCLKKIVLCSGSSGYRSPALSEWRCIGVIPGIGLAIVIAIAEFLWDGWRPHSAVLGRASGVKGYHDITRYPDARRIPGLVLFRWDAPLFLPTQNFSRSAFWTPWRNRRRPCVGWSLRRSRSLVWTSPLPIQPPNWTRSCTRRYRVLFCRTQGPRKRQIEEIWIVRAVWRELLFPDHWRSRFKLLGNQQ
jgi:hypothetical protein